MIYIVLSFWFCWFYEVLYIVYQGKMEGDSRSYLRLYFSLLNEQDKILRLEHHFKVCEVSLDENVVPKGLQLKKAACIGDVSAEFVRHWKDTLGKAEFELVRLLRDEVKRKRDEKLC